jgi:hypothetical protein
MTSYILIPFIIFNLVSADAVNPIYLDSTAKENVILDKGVLKAGIVSDNSLPEEFYGTWSVMGTIIKTSEPEVFKDKSSDIWTFEKVNSIITLTNPVSGASASIKVSEVNDNTATFTKETHTNKFKQYEKAKITIEGESFFGTDFIKFDYYRGEKLIGTSTVEYEVKGSKISGPRLEDIFAK